VLAGELKAWKRIEAAARRPLGQAAHPDDCPKLLIRRVAWAIPPRGLRVVPRFDVAGVRLSVSGEDGWPEAAQLVRAVGRVKHDRLCPACGQVVGGAAEIDLDAAGRRVLELAVALAGRALRRQYALTDEQLGELLAFDSAAAPPWLGQLIAWAAGLPPAGVGRKLPPPANRRRPWWKLWHRRPARAPRGRGGPAALRNSL